MFKLFFMSFVVFASYSQSLEQIDKQILEIESQVKDTQKLKEQKSKRIDDIQNEIRNIDLTMSSPTLNTRSSQIKKQKTQAYEVFKVQMKGHLEEFGGLITLWKDKTKEDRAIRKQINCLDTLTYNVYSYQEFILDSESCNKKKIISDHQFYKDFSTFKEVASINIDTILKKNIAKRKELRSKKNKIKTESRNISYEVDQLARKESTLNIKLDDLRLKKSQKEEDIAYIENNKMFLECSTQTVTIDLEAAQIHEQTQTPGPLKDIKRDYQGQIGSCFANTAKNLLAGISKGRINASFLDMALQYKRKYNKKFSDLDGGLSCHTLHAIKEKGYCPQSLSPVESGGFVKFLGQKIQSKGVNGQAFMIKKISSFLDAIDELKKDTSPLSNHLKSNIANMVKEVQSNKSISLPLPNLRSFPVNEQNIKTLFVHKLKIQDAKKIQSEVKNFLSQRNKFILKLMIANHHNASEQEKMAIYENDFKLYLSELGLDYYINATYNKSRIEYFIKHGYSHLTEQIENTVEFLAKNLLLDLNLNYEQRLTNIFNYIDTRPDIFLKLFAGVSELSSFLKVNNLDAQLLFNDNNEIKSADEILSKSTTPECELAENRIQVEENFSCHDLVNKQYTKDEFRLTVVKQLLNGIPVGNTFPQMSSYHINSIVGHRYNQETGNCQYKVRESQTGVSSWQNEDSIVEMNESLTLIKLL